jgi:hypothetical protein
LLRYCRIEYTEMCNTKNNDEVIELIKSLEENSVDLTSAMSTVKILDELELPLFEHILINQICKDLNAISPEINHDQEDEKVFRKIFHKVKVLKVRNPEWVFNHTPKKSTYFRKRMIEEGRLTLSQEEARELAKFQKETEVINQINTEKSFEENNHLFKLIKESRFTRIGRRNWLSFYRFPDLRKIAIYNEKNFLCKVEGIRRKYSRLKWSFVL